MQNELFTRMQYEPCILMFGKKYRSIYSDVISYNWNAVVTTNCDLELSASLGSDKRFVRDIFSKQNMQANLLDRKNLHVIRLFGETYPNSEMDEIDAEDVSDQAVVMLTRVSEVIKRNGVILIEDFDEQYFTHKELRKSLKGLYTGQKQVYIFNCQNRDQYIQALESSGIAVVYEESINDFFEEHFPQEDIEFEQEMTDRGVQFFIESDKKSTPVSIEKRQLLETESFATLLNLSILNEVRIPETMYKDYFYMFLKNSIREPQWYGYNYGFNLHRAYEDRLYRKVKRGLENVGKPNNRPLLVVGQTGTGKSISLAAISYKIFNEKKYPVIFINDPDVNFYSSTEYKQRGINKKGSPAFNALDALLEKLENMGAKATLLVWDTSSYSTGREKCYRLYQALLARGRKVFLLSTAYEMNETSVNTESDEDYVEENVLTKRFVECLATTDVSTEVEQLRGILLNKCNMDARAVDSILNYYTRTSNNFLSMFYQVFDILRGDLSKGVFREANINLQELDNILKQGIESADSYNIFALALKKAEKELVDAGLTDGIETEDKVKKDKIAVSKDEFIKCIAVCSQFKLKMPYDFALRILGTYNEQIIRTLSKSTFFVINQDYHGNYEISLRSPLEAKMYISAKSMMPMDEVDCVTKMLELMNPSGNYGQQQEVRLCEKLIRIIGPNNRENKNLYKKGYPEIISALKKMRIENDIWEPILISQEITYIREYYGRDESFNIGERMGALKEAIKIADDVLIKIEHTGISMGTRNAIIVESANSKLLLCQLREANDPLLFKELRRDLRDVIRYDNLDYHAYVTLLKGSIIEYKNEMDTVKKIELLEGMCSIADEIMFENPEVSNSEYFQGQVTEIYSLLDDSSAVQNYIDELVANGSAAGLYVKARKILFANDVDFRKNISNEIQGSACQEVYELFNDTRYKAVLGESESCQYMLLNIVWLINNKEPIYGDGECWITRISEKAWRELLNICNNFIVKFCNDAEDIHQLARNIRYIKALCLAQLGQYAESISVLKSIEEDSSQGIRRVFTKHMLCMPNGTPIKFVGRLGKYDEVSRSGSVYIDEFGKGPIYYHGPHMRTANLIEGTVFKDIEIGYSNIAPKAYREIEVVE